MAVAEQQQDYNDILSGGDGEDTYRLLHEKLDYLTVIEPVDVFLSIGDRKKQLCRVVRPIQLQSQRAHSGRGRKRNQSTTGENTGISLHLNAGMYVICIPVPSQVYMYALESIN